MRFGKRFAALALLAWAALGLHPAAAQTVDEIISRGTINIGMLVDLPPYGLLNDQQQPDGYDADVAKLLGKYLGVKVNLVQLTGPNRVPFLVTGKVDLVVGTLGITPERARQVAFSIPYSALVNKLWAAKGRAIKGPDDLKGLHVGVPRGSTQDAILSGMNSGARLQRFDDDATTYQAILSGQVDAIGETDVSTEQVMKANPSLDLEGKFVLLQQPNGIAMRRDQQNLLQWVNTFVYFIKNNGELNALHQKWVHTPLPTLPVF